MRRFTGFITAPAKWVASGVAGKTSWEWLELLIVPVLLAGGAFYIDNQSEKRQEAIASERYENETDLANERAKQETLNSYLEQMKELLLSEKLRTSPVDSEVRSVARAITTTTIKDLDNTRNALVIDFLRESKLLGVSDEESSISNAKKLEPILILAGLNLSGTDLTDANLRGANLNGAYLRGANLNEANLNKANLSEADLSYANLRGANLRGANLRGANLNEASLRGTNLGEADLSGANLNEADLWLANLSRADLRGTSLSDANLSDADLSGARNITKEQLKTAKLLCQTEIPEGIDLDPNRDCKAMGIEVK
jgi:uncharacterized protein YjbI with pentapeptide repeats